MKPQVHLLPVEHGSGGQGAASARCRLVPLQLGPYHILSAISAGGLGEVFRAHDPRLGRDVAIKILPESLSTDPQALARFEREAKAVAALSHPNILTIYDRGDDHGVSYAVTELLEGETLGDRIRRGPIPWREAVDIASAIAEGLNAAHLKGVVHRDLKPNNVFLTAEQRVKLLDFGLARWTPDFLKQDPASEITQSIEGTILGTIGYMSPEQVRGEPADTSSDIFSFGCVLYEMVTGQRAFQAGSAAETMTAILRERPAPPSTLGVSIPPDLERIIASCLEKQATGRFPGAQLLVAALKSVSGASSSSFNLASLRSLPRDGVVDSLAVLPFKNASGNPELDLVTDGIAESLINSLSRLGNMRVVARTTAFKYKGRDIDPVTIGTVLNVRAVLTGRVIQRGATLNVQSELVGVLEGSQIWGEQYSYKLIDIFVVQEVIAREITKKLKLKLSREEKKRLTRRYTQNSEAYQLYLRGRFYWNKRTPGWMQKGIEYFEAAIRMDPSYALAYAGLADCYSLLGSYSILPPNNAFQKAKSSAMKALEIDNSLAEAHTSLAFAQGFYDWDWRAAQRRFKRAIELSPSYPTAPHWYSYLLLALGRFDEALASTRRALDLDPLSLIINAQVAWGLHFAHRYDEAIEQARKTLEMDPNFGIAHLWLGVAHLHKGLYEEGIASIQTAEKILAPSPHVAGVLGYAYGICGRRDEAKLIISQLAAVQQRYIPPVTIAIASLGLGDLEGAFSWLQKSLEDRSWWLAWLKVDPLFDLARSDPRFDQLMSKIGLN